MNPGSLIKETASEAIVRGPGVLAVTFEGRLDQGLFTPSAAVHAVRVQFSSTDSTTVGLTLEFAGIEVRSPGSYEYAHQRTIIG